MIFPQSREERKNSRSFKKVVGQINSDVECLGDKIIKWLAKITTDEVACVT
jgi:hypothetical protein